MYTAELPREAYEIANSFEPWIYIYILLITLCKKEH